MTGLRLHHRRASLLSLAAAPLLVVSFTACTKKQERAPRPTATVSVVPAKRATVPYVIEANGIVTPMQTANVVSQVDGIILSVDFQEGDEVRAGQPLFHIDPRPYQNAYNASLAVLARDSANAAHAKAELDRYEKLLAARVVTQQDLAVQATAAATADATVRGDQAAIETAKFNLDNTVVRASIAGRTGGVLVRRGNLVRAGSGNAPRRDQSGSPDLRPVRDSVVSTGAGPSIWIEGRSAGRGGSRRDRPGIAFHRFARRGRDGGSDFGCSGSARDAKIERRLRRPSGRRQRRRAGRGAGSSGFGPPMGPTASGGPSAGSGGASSGSGANRGRRGGGTSSTAAGAIARQQGIAKAIA